MNSADKQGKILEFVHGFMPGLGIFSRYERSWFRSDLGAGLSVAAIALPVGIAYADLAGVPAVIGMYSAIFPLLAYALFGSSRQLMTGPDAATCIIAAAETPVEWVVIDASSINVVDITALQKVDELREELSAQGIVFASARVKPSLSKFFNDDWGKKHLELHARYRFDTLKSAVRAFNNRIEETTSPAKET